MLQLYNKSVDFSGQDIFIGIDVGLQSWQVTIMSRELEHKTYRQSADTELLVKYLHKNFPGANYHSAYEAGYSGFWIHDELKFHGIDSIVVNPADIPTSAKEKANKSDVRDSRKIARELRGGELTPIYTPTANELEDRMVHRIRAKLVEQQTRCKNQIKALLAFHGIHLPEKEEGIQNWSGRFIHWLREIKFHEPSATAVFSLYLEELIYMKKLIAEATVAVRNLSETDRYRENLNLLKSIPGISLLTGMTILTEIVDIKRFKSLNELASFVGLIPGEHSSGEKTTMTGITRRGNARLKTGLIESAWIATKRDPALHYAFLEFSKRMIKSKAIIKIARKLLNRIRFVLEKKMPYELAVLK